MAVSKITDFVSKESVHFKTERISVHGSGKLSTQYSSSSIDGHLLDLLALENILKKHKKYVVTVCTFVLL